MQHNQLKILISRTCEYTYCSFVLTVVNLISTIYLAISCNAYFPHQKVFRAGQIFKLAKVLNSVLQIGIVQINNHSICLQDIARIDKLEYRDMYLA